MRSSHRSPRPLAGLAALALLMVTTEACKSDPQPAGAAGQEGADEPGAAEPGADQGSPESAPSPASETPEPEPPPPEPEPEPEPEPPAPPLPPDPEPVAPEDAPTERERARLEQAGDLGRAVIDALRAKDAKAVLDLTPYGKGEWKKRCPAAGDVSGKREVEARINHCMGAIDWAKVSDVRLEGGDATGMAAEGCKDGTEGFERIRMLVVVPGRDWIVSLNRVVGDDGVAKGFAGAIACERRD